MLKLLNQYPNDCTGCGACYNICPKDAITMRPDNEGFLYPEIDNEKCVRCGKCEKVCPSLHPNYCNDTDPDCYAMMASDEEREKSSSGAIFAMLAKWILNRGGAVVGCAWTADWNAHHIVVENEADLWKLRGSKYFQSNTENTYNETVSRLNKGQWVLYSGMPCQIAGLYAVLGNQKPEKLVTVEILCHGTPSYKVFRNYLECNYEFDQIDYIAFRDKNEFGWSTNIHIRYKDGKEFNIRDRVDAYYQAFLPCMVMRPSCSSCTFSKLPRQGDFTIGDFWGGERYQKRIVDKKGTSIVLLNNQNARNIISQLSEDFKLWEKVPIEYATHINKTILHPFNAHPGRKHFFSMLGKKPFNQLVSDSLAHHYDVGVVGLWYGLNYGSVLTYFALYSLLRDLGYDPVMLPKPNNMWDDRFNAPDSLGQKFIWNHCNVFLPFPSQEEYVYANDLCRDFLVGSDVVWNYDICGRDVDQFFFLDWVESGHRKIAFASSLGNGLEGPDAYVEKAKHYLKKFDSLSVREKRGSEIIRKETGRSDVAFVLDPVFVCNPQVYHQIADSITPEEKPFVFAYILRKSMANQKLTLIRRACEYFSAESKICGNPVELDISRRLYGDSVQQPSIEEWLYQIKNCQIYIGDSYHGLCFALIFHRPFILIYGKSDYSYSGERFFSLLDQVGLRDRLLEDLDDPAQWERLLNTEIDWEAVDRRLADLKEYSFNWLKEALEKPPREPDMESYLADGKNREIASLSRRINEISRKVSEMSGVMTETSRKVDELSGTLDVTSRKVDELSGTLDATSRKVDELSVTLDVTSRKADELSRHMEEQSNELAQLQRNLSIPLKFWKGIRCLREHGLIFTIRKVAQKLKKKFNHEKTSI